MPSPRWSLRDIQQTTISGGFTIVCTTDVPCHMWLRYSSIEPQKHSKPILTRGILMSYDARFCFVAYHGLEQDEDGDTLIHTFTWLEWETCLTQWFYFWATIEDVPSLSTSPIFKKHYVAPIAPSLLAYHISPCDYLFMFYGNTCVAQSFKIAVDAYITLISLYLRCSAATKTGHIRLELRETHGSYPADAFLAHGTSSISACPTDAPALVVAQITPTLIQANTRYWIVGMWINDTPTSYLMPYGSNDDSYPDGYYMRTGEPCYEYCDWIPSPPHDKDFCFKVWGIPA